MNCICMKWKNKKVIFQLQKKKDKWYDEAEKWRYDSLLLFTRHYPARCFGMNMPKSRDIQAKIPLPQAIWNDQISVRDVIDVMSMVW